MLCIQRTARLAFGEPIRSSGRGKTKSAFVDEPDTGGGFVFWACPSMGGQRPLNNASPEYPIEALLTDCDSQNSGLLSRALKGGGHTMPQGRRHFPNDSIVAVSEHSDLAVWFNGSHTSGVLCFWLAVPNFVVENLSSREFQIGAATLCLRWRVQRLRTGSMTSLLLTESGWLLWRAPVACCRRNVPNTKVLCRLHIQGNV